MQTKKDQNKYSKDFEQSKIKIKNISLIITTSFFLFGKKNVILMEFNNRREKNI